MDLPIRPRDIGGTGPVRTSPINIQLVTPAQFVCWGTHAMPLTESHAKCPSALHMSAMVPEFKATPASVAIPS